MEVCRAVPGIHPHEHLRRSCSPVGGRPELVVYGTRGQVRRWVFILSFPLVSTLLLISRLATDLNLHQVSTTQPQTERQERELLNRTRVWMICFNLDRSTATQFGKPSTIKEDYITRNSADWYRNSQHRDKVSLVPVSHGEVNPSLIMP